MASSGRPLADLLRDVADQLENSPTAINAASSSHTPRHPVDAEVGRLFVPNVVGEVHSVDDPLLCLHSYTPIPIHSAVLLEDKNGELVPNRFAKQRLIAAGLGDKRLTFQGCQASPEEFCISKTPTGGWIPYRFVIAIYVPQAVWCWH